ncbi:hypothetical protein [Arthrobacter sp. M2012083]|uniref:hypothetical protein n=1 Tax=Arthrobacter sp. M2012083 TaxID=1197706 RepID=UPI0013046DBD|nr:hypothetical protein [Arthrobacter sp. M2012083]
MARIQPWSARMRRFGSPSRNGNAVYLGCGVKNQWGTIVVAFNADYAIVNGTYDTIDRVYNQTATRWGWGWSCTAPNFVPVKACEDGWGAATARAHSWVQTRLDHLMRGSS